MVRAKIKKAEGGGGVKKEIEGRIRVGGVGGGNRNGICADELKVVLTIIIFTYSSLKRRGQDVK